MSPYTMARGGRDESFQPIKTPRAHHVTAPPRVTAFLPKVMSHQRGIFVTQAKRKAPSGKTPI